MLDASISVSDIEEASALGVAIAGGLGVGIWKDLNTLEKLYKCSKKVTPNMSQEKRNELYDGWKKAVKMIRSKS